MQVSNRSFFASMAICAFEALKCSRFASSWPRGRGAHLSEPSIYLPEIMWLFYSTEYGTLILLRFLLLLFARADKIFGGRYEMDIWRGS